MITISRKLTLAFLLVAVITAALVAVIMRLTSPERLNLLLREQAQSQLETLLVDYYTVNGSFTGVSAALQAGGFIPPVAHPNQPGQPINIDPPANRLVFALVDRDGVVIVSTLSNYLIGTRLPPDRLRQGRPIKLDGAVIGTLLVPVDRFILTPAEQDYLSRTNQVLWLAALGAILVALAASFTLAYTFTRPLRSLTAAAHSMANGDLEQEVPVTSRDEIGQLTEAFNSMSRSVARANAQRRQMTADIAHDLRTPLTVIGGYIESMQDGTLEPTPKRLETIHQEIERLQHMVEDLRLLSRADAGELVLLRTAVAPHHLLERITSVYLHPAQKQGIELKIEVQQDLPDVRLDEERIIQVLCNLMDNALRYTPTGGVITLQASRGNHGTLLCVQDTGQGILPEDLPHVFERFYRADRSRNGSEGTSGLGLAIARALVLAHGGSLIAESVPGYGTRMIIHLPDGETRLP